MATLLPYRSKFERINIDRIVEQENENLVRREMMIAQEAMQKFKLEGDDKGLSNHKYSVEALEKEWNQLSAEVRQMEKDYKNVDPVRRETMVKRINEVAERWKRERDFADFSKFS